MIRRSQTRMSGESLKRGGSLESPQILAKVPKVENDPVVNEENIEKTKINDALIEKIDKLVKEVEKFKSSNQEAFGDLNSKLDKVLNILDENADESSPSFQIFVEHRGNVMTCYWESFFDMENFMTSYGITGKNVTSHILSFLDFKSMIAARVVSKTWYTFIENERGLWINLMRKCFEDIHKRKDAGYESDRAQHCLPEWRKFGEEIIEKNGKVADIVTLISKLEFKFNIPKPHGDQYPNHFCSPTKTIIHLEYKKDENLWQNLNFVKILVKYGVLDGAMGQKDFLTEGHLLSWSLLEIETLKYVVSILKDKFKFQLTNYCQYFQHYKSSPMWEAMRQKENGLENVQIMIPLAARKFWNSGKNPRYMYRKPDEVDHTPLADAIMIGNVEMVKAIMPYTKVTANPKGRGFVSYLHVAAKYGQLEILKILLEYFEKKKFDWLKLKDKEGRSVWDLLKRKSFHVETYDPTFRSASKAEENEGKKRKQDMLEFVEIKGKECKEDMFKFIESIMIRHVNSVLFPRKK
jgi:hypothetical protein